MFKNNKKKFFVNLENHKKIFIFLFCLIFIKLLSYFFCTSSRYKFFVEFNDANNIKIGTPIRFRGINIGSIQNIKLKFDCVLVLASINSNNIIIPKNSIIETTQTGLLNESVVDIVAIDNLENINNSFYDPVSYLCDTSRIICNNMYFIGNRGLNYDDLVRSTTRISQRFDDPRFFNLFYLFLQNGIEITDVFLELLISILELFCMNNANI